MQSLQLQCSVTLTEQSKGQAWFNLQEGVDFWLVLCFEIPIANQFDLYLRGKLMALFDQILSAIDNPNQQASSSQLGDILGAVQQFSSTQGVDASASETALSMVGGYVRNALQQKRASGGDAQVDALVNQYAGTRPNPSAVQALFSPAQQQQITQAIGARTGLNPAIVQMVVAAAVPIVLNLLSTGATKSSPQAGSSNNSVLNVFLDSDRDGDVDMADTIAMAGRFFNQNR